jgi:hypothetical protein
MCGDPRCPSRRAPLATGIVHIGDYLTLERNGNVPGGELNAGPRSRHRAFSRNEDEALHHPGGAGIPLFLITRHSFAISGAIASRSQAAFWPSVRSLWETSVTASSAERDLPVDGFSLPPILHLGEDKALSCPSFAQTAVAV